MSDVFNFFALRRIDLMLINNAKAGNLDVVRDLLRRGANVNERKISGNSALIQASRNGHVEVVRALLNHKGVDVNIKDHKGCTPLARAGANGHLEVVRALLNHNRVDVNRKDEHGWTVLMYACCEGHLELVRALLNHQGVDVNSQNEYGFTPLMHASQNGSLEVVRALLSHNRVEANIKNKFGDTALDRAFEASKVYVVRLLEEHMELKKHREEEERNPRKEPEADTPSSEVKRPSSTAVALMKDQRLLQHVMNTTSAEPVELSLEYIDRCVNKNQQLGKGAFGDVFLAEDCCLPKKFAVKMISFAHCNEAAIKEIRKTFQTELLTLQTFRHPNIIVLYGFSLNANSIQQCLVYEYAANGSLAGFYTDDGNRARLSADTRLSIMFKLARAVHFLHTGGCKVAGKGWKVFHRDITSANICLVEDFTPRLIDCGLAEFVQDDNSRATPGSLQSKISGVMFGTPGYMCPEYSRKKTRGVSCPFIAAYDVYSIGVVLVELILGCLNGVQSTRNDSLFLDVFEKYVQGERSYHRIVDGWEKLKRDADPTIIWNQDALEIACKAAIQCMDPFPEERLKTKDLLDKLGEAINWNACVGLHHPAAVSAVDSDPYCLICNEYRTDIKCDEGHALCTTCIVDKICDDTGCQLLCLIKECSSELHDKDLHGRIPVETYKRYVEKRADQTKLDEYFSQLHLVRSDLYVVQVGDENTNELLQKQQQMLQRLAKGLNRSLAALALLSSNQIKECPNLVWLNPTSVEKKDRYTPKKWIRDEVLQKYSVIFICAHSGEPGHEAFEIEVPRRWIVKVAPWLKLCLQAIKAIATSQGLPFPIPNLPSLEQYELMKTFLDSAIEEASNAVLANCEAFLENGTVSTIDTYGQMQTLAGDAFKFIAEKARANTNWKSRMVPVCRHNGTPIWVKSTYEAHFEVSTRDVHVKC